MEAELSGDKAASREADACDMNLKGLDQALLWAHLAN